MKAVIFSEFGGSDRLELRDVPTPTPGHGEVRVRVRAASLNHLDIWTRSGAFGGHIPLPHIGGCDAAGEVVAVGEGVTRFDVGDKVAVAPGIGCGHCEFCLHGTDSLCATYRVFGFTQQGGFAEYAVVEARQLVAVGDALTYEEWTSLGVAYLTAWHMLFTRAQLRPGERVLVHAAGSGVGMAAIQLAAMAGARVFTNSASDAKLARARKELGAEASANYDTEDVAAAVRAWTDGRGVDVVIDHIGPATWQTNLEVLRKGGRLVNCGVTSGPAIELQFRPVYARQISVLGSYLGHRHEFESVLRMAESGRLRPIVDRVFPLEKLAEAQDTMEGRGHFGKIVIRVP